MTRPAWTYISSTNGITDFSSLNSNVAITAPTNIAGCFAWYRADLGITLSSSFVTDWADQSGNNRNFTQATPAIRPTYVVSSASFNNKPVLVFGGSHYMQTVAFGALLQPFTYYIVGKANNVASYFLGSLTGGVNEVGLLANIGGNFVLYAGVTALSNNSLSTTLIPQTMCGIFNAANSLGYIDNSVTDILTSHNVSTNTPTGFTLGATYIPSNYLDGYIAEIIVYSGSHTTAQRTSVMQYLSGRYATPGRIIANISSSLSFTRNSPATVQTGLSTLVSMSIDANVAVIGRTLNTDTFGLQQDRKSVV